MQSNIICIIVISESENKGKDICVMVKPPFCIQVNHYFLLLYHDFLYGKVKKVVKICYI